MPQKKYLRAEDGSTLSEVADDRRTVICVALREPTLILRTPYDGKILEIVSDMTFGKSEDGGEIVSYRITGLQFVPELYSALVLKAHAIGVPEVGAFEAARAAITFYMHVDSPNSEHVVPTRTPFAQGRRGWFWRRG